MKEKRTILGYIRHSISGRPEIAFPEVRAWLKEPGNVVARPLPATFPDSGTVFLHARAAFNSNPLPDHYGIFECQQSERPGTAAWEVSRTDDSICQVVPITSALERPLDFYAEMEAGKLGRFANAFCGNGRYFLLTQDGWVIGPFVTKNGTVTAATERTLRWKKNTIDLLHAGESDFCFISSRSLSAGTTFPPTLQDAIRRTLKLISKKGRCSFLSRQHIGELAEEMTKISAEDELSWFVAGMNQLLPAFQETLEVSDELARELLGNQAIGDLLETRWRNAHLEKVEQEESKLKLAGEALQKITAEHDLLVKTTAELARQSEELQASIVSQKTAAHDAFQAEISRLSADPSQIAILSSLLSRAPTPASHQTLGISPWTEIAAPTGSAAPTNGTAIVQGLLDGGLSIRCAHDVATAAMAAFIAGQAVSIKSPLAALFAEALLFGGGHPTYWACEVPAGLLEAIPSPVEKFQGPVGLLFHGANRSDYNLVLAAFRVPLLKQNMGGVPPTIDAVLTLDDTEGLVIEQPLPTGPCIGPDFLNFADAPKSPTIRPFPIRSSDAITPIKPDEFEEMFPQSSAKVGFFQNSFLLLMARKYCAALKSAGCEPSRVKELFLKYWLLPRLSRSEVAKVLNDESALCHADAGLATRLSSYLDE